jgi:hypothetical protein
MRQFALEALNVYDRYPYARVNMVGAAIGGSYQVRRKEIGQLCHEGHLRRHNPNGSTSSKGVRLSEPNLMHRYPTNWHRLHSKPSTKNKFNWHDVMVSDVMLSIEAACRSAGLSFHTQDEILKGTELVLPASVTWAFEQHTETSKNPVRPDQLFAIGDDYYFLEADRGSESVDTNTLENRKSWHRSLLQYADIFKRETFKSLGIPYVRLLCMLDSTAKMHTIQKHMQQVLKLAKDI